LKNRRFLALLPLLSLLGGCQAVLLSPSGDVALQQRNLMLISTALMLTIIIPVMALTVFFAWRYRASAKADYDPDWNHSLPLEVVIWAVPLLIIVILGALTWMGTHLLDPYRPLNRISAATPITTAQAGSTQARKEPLVIQVVALDWKWLFLYPQQGIASVNEVVAPVNQPIEFRITASSVMNSLFIPALAGQIYAMPGMQTKLNAVINHPGDFEGFSANYSGEGFSGMRFRFRGLEGNGFEDWVKAARDKGDKLGREEYLVLERPSEREPARQFGNVAPNLFDLILNMCVDRAKMCMRDMMAMDAKGGGGKEGISTVMALEYDKSVRRGGAPMPPRPFVTAICTPADVYGKGEIARASN